MTEQPQTTDHPAPADASPVEGSGGHEPFQSARTEVRDADQA